MNRLDRLIEETLNTEDRALFAQYEEQGLLGQVGGLFAGKLGWVNGVQIVAQLAMTAAGAVAAVKFIGADDPIAMARWGMLLLFLMMAISVIKMMQWQQIQANRIIREVKRVELQLARSKAV